MEFFPIYTEQMEDKEFLNLSPVKKSYYFLLQSMFNKFGEFYYTDTNFAAALKCSYETITKARREFVKRGWITIVPGRKDKHGRGLATQYTAVKWSRPPKKDDGMQFAPFQRYTLEMLLNKGFSLDCIVVYMALSYWRHFNHLDNDDFFITKSQLRELTGLKGMNKVEGCIDQLYHHFQYSGKTHLFEYADLYHKYKFSQWAEPSEPAADETNRRNQKAFWDSVVQQGRMLQKKKQAKENEKKMAEVIGVYDYFKMRYKDYYGNEPAPADDQIAQLLMESKKIGEIDMRHSINRFFLDDIKPKSQRRTLKRFLDLQYWKNTMSVK